MVKHARGTPTSQVTPPLEEVWFEHGGTRLFAVESGRGRPIIFLHGGLSNHLASLGVVRALIPEYRVIMPDLRGSGRSVNAGRLSWDDLADDLDCN
jgi:pimeloyl-ACP methyl ester carboxylesterase